MSSLQAVTAVTVSGALVFGMALALLGRLKLALARRLQLGEGQVRRLVTALNLAVVPMVLAAGIALDVYGPRPVLIAGSVALSLALFALSLRPATQRSFAAVLLGALGASAVCTASTVLMPRAFFAPAETTASLNLGYVFVALGALITPVLADVLLEAIEFRRTLAVFALLALVPAVLGAFPAASDWRVAEHAGDAVALVTEQTIWVAGLVFFFYAALEASVSVWTLTFLADRGHHPRQAFGLLSGFWAAFLAGRLLVALLQHTGWLTEAWDPWIIGLPALLAAVVVGNLSGAANRGNSRGGLVLLGLLLGPVAPTLIGLVFRHVAPAEQGLAFGLVFGVGSLGSFMLAPLIDVRAGKTVQAALRVPMFIALLLTAVALVLGLITP
jgi:MFS family permease